MLANRRVALLSLFVAVLMLQGDAQLLDRLMNMNTRSSEDIQDDQLNKPAGMVSDLATTLKRMMSNIQANGIPSVYEMNKNGSSMGINVLSGLVKVERGREAERNGLVGPRPLSVRIFGMPVFERGQRVRPPSGRGSESALPGGEGREENGRPDTGPDEELPIDP